MNAQDKTIKELEAKGWSYVERDASGRRIVMERKETGEFCKVVEDGRAFRQY